MTAAATLRAMIPVLDWHAECAGRRLPCGISIRPMTAMGLRNTRSEPMSEASARSLCGVSEGPHHILARDDAHQLPLGADDGKAASLQAHHQLENSRQRSRRLD